MRPLDSLRSPRSLVRLRLVGLVRLPLFGLVLALPLAGCSGSELAAAQAVPVAAAVPVHVASVDHTPVREPLRVPGLTAPRDTYDLAFPTGGVLQAVLVDEGDAVRGGAVLARIDGTAIRASVAEAHEGLVRAERDLTRARALAASGTIPSITLDDAATGAEVARAHVTSAGFLARYASLRAPSEGFVEARLADAGEIVAAGQPILRIGSTERGWILRIGVPDRSVVRMREGDVAEVRLDAAPDDVITARVVSIARTPSAATGTFEVELALEEVPVDLVLRTGLVGRAAIPLGTTYTASVPIASLVDGHDHRAFVFVPEGETARRVAVEIAYFEGERAVVRSGLNDVESVVTAGADRLTEETRFTIVEE